MFWRLGFAQSSPIETLLDSDNFTLQQLLDEDDLVQECKQINNKLLDLCVLSVLCCGALPLTVDASVLLAHGACAGLSLFGKKHSDC